MDAADDCSIVLFHKLAACDMYYVTTSIDLCLRLGHRNSTCHHLVVVVMVDIIPVASLHTAHSAIFVKMFE